MITEKEKLCKDCIFIKAVKEMRKAQKTYFTIRGSSELNKAKALEKKIDALIDEYENPQREQIELF